MESEELSWLSVFPVLNGPASPDRAIYALLHDDRMTDTLCVTPQRPMWTWGSTESDEQPALSITTSSSSSTTWGTLHPSAPPATHALETKYHNAIEMQEAKPTAKRQRSMRPKEEIDYLTRSVVDLEKLIELLHRRRRLGLSTADAAESNAPPSDSIWMGVASRQYKRLRESQSENEQLRDQVQNQFSAIQSLVRLVQRAQKGLPVKRVHGSIAFDDARLFASKRLELLDTTMQMLHGIDFAFIDERFQSTSAELSDVMIYQQLGKDVPLGTPLASGWIRRNVPQTVDTISESLWLTDLQQGISKDTLQVEFVERSPDRQVLQYAIRFGVSERPVQLYGAIVRLRDRNSPSHTLITASSMWPSPANESPWNYVGIDTKQWAILHPRHRSPAHPRTEVLVNTRLSKIARPFAISEGGEAAVVQSFAAKSIHYTMERLHRDVDNVLLGQTLV